MNVDDMLLVEDNQTGAFCCEFQKEHTAQMKAMREVITGRQQRAGCVVALGSGQKPSTDGRRISIETIQDQPILNLDSLEAMLMTDQPRSTWFDASGKRKQRSPSCFTAVSCPVWMAGGVQLGEEGVIYSFDFFRMPRRPTQRFCGTSTQAGPVLAPLDGPLVIYRVGQYLDVCIGEHIRDVPTICYRFYARDFLLLDGVEPAAKVIGVRPTVIDKLVAAELYPCKGVKAGDPIVLAQWPVTYQIASLNSEADREAWRENRRRDSRGRKRDTKPDYGYVPETLGADKRRTFAAALRMNEQLTAGTNHAGRLQEVRTLVEFPLDRMGHFINAKFLPPNLPPKALAQDVLRALGPDGLQRGSKQFMLKITADTSGKIAAIASSDSAVTIVYENGREQLLPPTAKLTKLTNDGLVELAKGMEVRATEVIGDYIDRFEAKSHDYAEVELLMGNSISSVLEAMVTKTAVIDKKIADGMLVDAQYAEGCMDESVQKQIGQKIFLDCSTLTDLYEPKSKFIIIPIGSPSYPVRELTTSSLHVTFAKHANKRYSAVRKRDGSMEESEENVPEGAVKPVGG